MSDHAKVAIPAARSRLGSLKLRRRLILAGLLTAAAAGVAAAIAWLTYSPPVPTPPSTVAASSVALARQVAADYLAGRPTTVSVAKGVDPTFGYASANKTAFTVADGPTVQGVARVNVGGQPVNQVTFYVVLAQKEKTTVDGTAAVTTVPHPYLLTVPMSLAGDTGWQPALAAAPSLAPFTGTPPNTLDPASLSTLPGATSAGALPAGAQTQLKDWATAYAAAGHGQDDAAARTLKQITGDQDPAHAYGGLGGWTVASQTATDAAPAPTSDDPNHPYPGGWVVRVALVLEPPGANGPTVRSDYDVWVAGQGQEANPPVIAWGPAGSYAQLYPYMNATPAG